jgi:prepilin-type N-terminal cleavage/methylation domain-containing protein
MKSAGNRHGGFTLIELIISAGLMSIILVSSYLCLQAALSSQKLIEPRLETLQSARVALALLGADLRCACPISKDYDLVGTHRVSGDAETDSIDFATHNYTPRRAGEGDFCQESFFLDKDPPSGRLALWRRRNPYPAGNPFSGGSREQLVKGVAGLRLEYSDGTDWYESWGDSDGKNRQQFSSRYRANLAGMPEAVRITLLLESDLAARPAAEEGGTTNSAPPLVFQTVTRIVLADAEQSAGGGESGTNAAPESATPPPNAFPGGNP